MIAYYKKTTEILEQKFKQDNSVFNFMIREFKSEFMTYYQNIFQQILESKVEENTVVENMSKIRETISNT